MAAHCGDITAFGESGLSPLSGVSSPYLQVSLAKQGSYGRALDKKTSSKMTMPGASSDINLSSDPRHVLTANMTARSPHMDRAFPRSPCQRCEPISARFRFDRV